MMLGRPPAFETTHHGPKLSVPNGCSGDGPVSMAWALVAKGSVGKNMSY